MFGLISVSQDILVGEGRKRTYMCMAKAMDDNLPVCLTK